MRNILEGYKIFDIDPTKSRPKKFWVNVLKYRKHTMKKFGRYIKPLSQFQCPLCGSKKGTIFLVLDNYHLIECEKCGLVSCNVDFSRLGNHDVYDDKAYVKNTKVQILDTYEYRKKILAPERFNYILQKTKLPENKVKLLDVGCGPGYLLSHLKDRGVNYKGLELADFLVKICKQKKLNVENADLRNEPSGAYNVVTLFDVLEHLTDPIDLFRSINPKLSKNGFLLAYTPNIHSLSFLLMKENQNNIYPFQHLCFFDVKSLNYLAKKTGFKIYSHDYYGLDLTDYFCMKSYEDKYDYLTKLKEFIPIVQSIIDKQEKSNHIRVVFQKIHDLK